VGPLLMGRRRVGFGESLRAASRLADRSIDFRGLSLLATVVFAIWYWIAGLPKADTQQR